MPIYYNTVRQRVWNTNEKSKWDEEIPATIKKKHFYTGYTKMDLQHREENYMTTIQNQKEYERTKPSNGYTELDQKTHDDNSTIFTNNRKPEKYQRT